MATAEQIKALLKSHAEGDEARFYAIAMQVAAHAARQGHGRLALDLRSLIDEAKARVSAARRPSGPVPLAQPRGDLAGLLSVAYPETRLADMVLDRRVKKRLERVLLEYRQQDKLRSHGLEPRRKILLLGPPGSGKTMTASALAGELQWPLFTILLDGLITKFMGETAAKLRLVFDAISKARGVYLFDEFDAIGVRRDSDRDVGEIRRVLNSFLQFVEQDESQSIIVAATNHPDLLDPALYRRFDDTIVYSLPSDDFAERLLRGQFGGLDTRKVDWRRATEASRGLSYADITRACEDAAKDAILNGTGEVITEALLHAIEERRVSPN
jgi:SpoVK/Ycf46/Vps4 family AAA+-type ATPase